MGWLSENSGVLLNGVATGALLFMMAVGLTVVFGLFDVLNLAHGAIFLTGAYLGYRFAGEVSASWVGFSTALVLALVVGGLMGVLLMVLLRPVSKRGHVTEALLTLGLALVITETLLELFGSQERSVAVPPALAGSVDLLGATYPVYRLGVIGVGIVVAVVVWYVLERTPAGAVARATVADRQMVEAVGIDVRRVTVLTFAIASALAVVGGVLAGPVVGASAGVGNRTLLLALVVIVIGGLGSVVGTMVGSLVIGVVQNLGVVLAPELASFLLFGAMVLVLTFRPQGLFPSTAAVAR